MNIAPDKKNKKIITWYIPRIEDGLIEIHSIYIDIPNEVIIDRSYTEIDMKALGCTITPAISIQSGGGVGQG